MRHGGDPGHRRPRVAVATLRWRGRDRAVRARRRHGADRERSATRARSIARMLGLGLPVPPAFVPADRRVPPLPRRRRAPRRRGLGRGPRRRGGPRAKSRAPVRRRRAPLLVSVRSGAAVSMPGMMDTILNLGITDAVEAALAAAVRRSRLRPLDARALLPRVRPDRARRRRRRARRRRHARAGPRRRSTTTPASGPRPTRTTSCAPRSTRSSSSWSSRRADRLPQALGRSPRTAAPR